MVFADGFDAFRSLGCASRLGWKCILPSHLHPSLHPPFFGGEMLVNPLLEPANQDQTQPSRHR